jgi:hypothetical protein
MLLTVICLTVEHPFGTFSARRSCTLYIILYPFPSISTKTLFLYTCNNNMLIAMCRHQIYWQWLQMKPKMGIYDITLLLRERGKKTFALPVPDNLSSRCVFCLYVCILYVCVCVHFTFYDKQRAKPNDKRKSFNIYFCIKASYKRRLKTIQ